MADRQAGRVLVVAPGPDELRRLVGLLGDRRDLLATSEPAQAVPLARAVPGPDVILLAAERPGFDACELCARLTASDGERAVPILMLTPAGDTDAERRALAAGAADCLGTPCADALLRRRVHGLLSVARGGETAGVAGSQAVAPVVAPARALAAPGLDTVAGLARVRGNRRLYRSLLRSFLDGSSGLIEELHRLDRSGALEGVRRLAHRVKGVAANLGAEALAEAAAALDAAAIAAATLAHRDGSAAMRDGVLVFETRLEQVRAGIIGYLDETSVPDDSGPVPATGGAHPVPLPAPKGAPDPAVRDPAGIRSVLVAVMARLDQDLGTAFDLLAGLEPVLAGSVLRGEFAQLRASLAGFDMELAQGLIGRLIDAVGPPGGPAPLPVVCAEESDAGPRPRLLVVDAAPENLHILVAALKDRYAISATRDGDRALRLAAAVPQPDLILLNVVLPGLDGYEICRRLKANAATAWIPVIFLTGLDRVEDEALGLRAGAADYIVKPVTLPVLELRLKLHLHLLDCQRRLEQQNRRLLKAAKQREDLEQLIQQDLAPVCSDPSAPAGADPAGTALAKIRTVLNRIQREADRGALVPDDAVACRFAEWRLDLERRALTRTGGSTTTLTRHEFLVLQAFLENAGRTISRPFLLEAIGHSSPQRNDRAVDGLVHRLRRKLQEDPGTPRMIRSEHGQGYRFSVPVTWE